MTHLPSCPTEFDPVIQLIGRHAVTPVARVGDHVLHGKVISRSAGSKQAGSADCRTHALSFANVAEVVSLLFDSTTKFSSRYMDRAREKR